MYTDEPTKRNQFNMYENTYQYTQSNFYHKHTCSTAKSIINWQLGKNTENYIICVVHVHQECKDKGRIEKNRSFI